MDKSQHNRAVDWHNIRRRYILEKFPEAYSNEYDPLQIVYLFVFVFLYWVSIYSLKYLSFSETILLSATLGSFLLMCFFNLKHELCHNLIHPSIVGIKKISLMLLLDIPTLNGLYVYYRWFHYSHHRLLGSESSEETFENAINFKPVDGDNLDPIQNLAHRRRKNENSVKVPLMLRNRYLRVMWIGLIRPPLDVAVGIFAQLYTSPSVIYKIIKLTYLKSKNKDDNNSRDLLKNNLELIIYRILNITVIFILYFEIGVNFLYYLFFSSLFFFGFLLHPFVIYWVFIHKGYYTENGCQPTSSIYGPVMTFLCSGINRHTEHHDMINIPVRKTESLSKKIPELYNDICHYGGLFQGYKALFSKNDTAWVYGCQTKDDEVVSE